MEEDNQEINDETSAENNEEEVMAKKQNNAKPAKVENLPKTGKKTRNIELVKDAIIDLNKEINRIKKDKSSLNSELVGVDQGLDNAQQLEKRLQEKISRLESKEVELVNKKKQLKQKADSLGERLDKVKSIKDQLTEV